MFTIKFVEPGREFSVECESYVFRQEESGFGSLFGYDTPYETDDWKACFSGRAASSGGPDSRSAYVMNRYGSTVATFHWQAENPHPAQMQADPNFVAAQMAA